MTAARPRALFWSLAALLVGSAAVGYAALLGREPDVPQAPPAPPPAAPELVLTLAGVEGTVERIRGGVRTAAVAGERLLAEDVLETGAGGRAELAAGDSYTVVLEGAARFDVQAITAELSRFRLVSGLVAARVREDPARTLEIESGEGAVVRTRGGELSVARSGRVVAVAALAGEAELSAAGATTRLAAGEHARVVDGAPPGPAAALPPSLLLKVTWPAERATNQPRITVRGRTEPGALVVMGGEPVEVAPDGTFTHVIHLREGRQPLSASARAVGGRGARADGPAVVLDTRPPDARFDTRGLWGERPR